MKYVYVKKDGIVKKIEDSILSSYLEDKWVISNVEDQMNKKVSLKASNKPVQNDK